MPTLEDVKSILKQSVDYVTATAKDFGYCWKLYPNVLIWCGVAFLIALFV